MEEKSLFNRSEFQKEKIEKIKAIKEFYSLNPLASFEELIKHMKWGDDEARNSKKSLIRLKIIAKKTYYQMIVPAEFPKKEDKEEDYKFKRRFGKHGSVIEKITDRLKNHPGLLAFDEIDPNIQASTVRMYCDNNCNSLISDMYLKQLVRVFINKDDSSDIRMRKLLSVPERFARKYKCYLTMNHEWLKKNRPDIYEMHMETVKRETEAENHGKQH